MASGYQGLEGDISSSLTMAKNFTNEAALEMLLEGLSGKKMMPSTQTGDMSYNKLSSSILLKYMVWIKETRLRKWVGAIPDSSCNVKLESCYLISVGNRYWRYLIRRAVWSKLRFRNLSAQKLVRAWLSVWRPKGRQWVPPDRLKWWIWKRLENDMGI